MKKLVLPIASKIADLAGLLVTPLAGSVALAQTRIGSDRLPLSFKIWDKIGVLPVRHHYYEPVLRVDELPDDLWTRQDDLGGINLRTEQQLELLKQFAYRDELTEFPEKPAPNSLGYYYDNESFRAGDSEILYSIIRHFKPRRVYEIGSGMSSRMARHALDANQKEGIQSRHLCVEPFEMPWLEQLHGTEVVRERIERMDLSLFEELASGDILFIDSSHVLRTGGDVYTEYLRILPRLKPGVLVHIHDIFFPFDYPKEWVKHRRRFWTEQYLLQAFLAFNSEFETVLSLFYLLHSHPEALLAACPVLESHSARYPGSFWIRRRLPKS